MIIADIAWTHAASRALRRLAGAAVEHGWHVAHCRHSVDESGDVVVVDELLRLELRRDLAPTVVLRIEAAEVWADGSHACLTVTEHVAGARGLVVQRDLEPGAVVARLRALGET